jgi:tRNA threonylcarbamoyladenosine biosynthesis protein TsaE
VVTRRETASTAPVASLFGSESEREIIGAEAMQRLGAELASRLAVGDTLLLHGDLGAGKTTLTQGIARALGVRGPVTSPTFTLVSEHRLPKPVRGIERLYHLDLYRLNDPDDLESIGYEEYLSPPDGVSVIEWPERAGAWLPDRALIIEIEHSGEDRRMVRLRRMGG